MRAAGDASQTLDVTHWLSPNGTYLKPVEDRHRCSRRGRDGPLETLGLQRVTDAAIADPPFIAALLAGSRSDGGCVEDMSATQKPLRRNGFRTRAQDNGTSGTRRSGDFDT
jgi:hypothetical protein